MGAQIASGDQLLHLGADRPPCSSGVSLCCFFAIIPSHCGFPGQASANHVLIATASSTAGLLPAMPRNSAGPLPRAPGLRSRRHGCDDRLRERRGALVDALMGLVLTAGGADHARCGLEAARYSMGCRALTGPAGR